MQFHIPNGSCEKIFDFAMVFTVYSPNVSTECQQFINDPIVNPQNSGCGEITLSTVGQYIIFLQIGKSESLNFYLTRTGHCGPEDAVVISLSDRLDILGHFLITRYMLPLQFNNEPIPGFNMMSLEIVFNISVMSLTCTLEIFYERRMTWMIERYVKWKTLLIIFRNNTVTRDI